MSLAQAQNLYSGISGTSIGYAADYQIRHSAISMAASLIGNSTTSPELLIDAAKKIEAYLRGEDATKN